MLALLKNDSNFWKDTFEKQFNNFLFQEKVMFRFWEVATGGIF